MNTANSPSDTSIVPFDGQISVQSRLASRSVPAGDTLVYEITLSWSGGSENYVFWPPKIPHATGLQFSHMQTLNQKKSTVEGYQSKTVFCLFFVGETPGEAEIGHSEIKYVSRGAKDSEVLHIQSQTLTVLPPRTQIKASLIIKAVLIVLLLASLILGFLRIRRQRKARANAILEKSPQERAMDRMSTAKGLRMAGNNADYYHEVMILLKDLLVQKQIVSDSKKPVSEINNCIDNSSLNNQAKLNWKSVLRTCEEMRFAGYMPEPHEIELFEAKVKDVIRDYS